jgi:hypothetical protein
MRVTGFTRPLRLGDHELFKNESDSTTPLAPVDMDVFCAPELSTSRQGPEVDLYSIGATLPSLLFSDVSLSFFVTGGVLYNLTDGNPPPQGGQWDATDAFAGAVWSDESVVAWGLQVSTLPPSSLILPRI